MTSSYSSLLTLFTTHAAAEGEPQYSTRTLSVITRAFLRKVQAQERAQERGQKGGLYPWLKRFVANELAPFCAECLSKSASAGKERAQPELFEEDEEGGGGEDEVGSDAAFYARVIEAICLEDLAIWQRHGRQEAILAHRLKFLNLLSQSHVASHARRERAFKFVLQHLDFHTGWEKLVLEGKLYQLGETEHWWRPGEFVRNEHERRQLMERGRDLEEHHFSRVTRQQYLTRARVPVTLVKMGDHLISTVLAIVTYTASRSERSDVLSTASQIKDMLMVMIQRELAHHSTPIPLQPFYSLPKEMRNMGSMFVSLKEERGLELHDQGRLVQDNITGGRAKLHNQHTLLFYDTTLIRRKSARVEQFIELRLDASNSSVLDALIQALDQLDLDKNLLEHVPRVLAGFFNAAQRDRHLDFSVEGAFWDTDSGRRLCTLVGFEPDNKRHRKRIQDIRQLMERIILHREVIKYAEDGQTYQRIAWRGPLITCLNQEVEIEVGNSEGMTGHSTLHAWMVAHPLWQMVCPKEAGGAPSFMSLDERAFALNSSDSLYFNLYWALINRAYLNRLDASGSFSLTLQTLYTWSGLQGRFERGNKLRAFLIKALELMVDHQLLTGWECEELGMDRVGLETLLDASLTVTFSSSQLVTLEHLLPSEHKLQLTPSPALLPSEPLTDLSQLPRETYELT